MDERQKATILGILVLTIIAVLVLLIAGTPVWVAVLSGFAMFIFLNIIIQLDEIAASLKKDKTK
jgi:hypothetical protein